MTEREFGELKANHDNLEDRVDKLEFLVKEKLSEVNNKMDILIGKFAEANGGWKALTILTSIAVTIGVLLSKFITFKIGG